MSSLEPPTPNYARILWPRAPESAPHGLLCCGFWATSQVPKQLSLGISQRPSHPCPPSQRHCRCDSLGLSTLGSGQSSARRAHQTHHLPLPRSGYKAGGSMPFMLLLPCRRDKSCGGSIRLTTKQLKYKM